MKIRAVRIIQKQLQTLGIYTGAIDGKRGPKTNAAIASALQTRSNDLQQNWSSWSDKRKAIAFFQLICKDNGIEIGVIDGFWGPQTDFGYDSLVHLIDTDQLPFPWRDTEPLDVNPNGWPRQTQAEMRAFYGSPCSSRIVKVSCPWTLKIAWNLSQKVTAIGCHERVAESLDRILFNVFDHYGKTEIERLGLDLYGGCYNCRKKRGGSTYSNHAWAAAIDWDPSHNRYQWGRSRARLDHPDYDDWWRFWEEEGWLSLGRTKNFDWMHIQAAKL